MEVWESASILKYSEGNAIKIVPVQFGTIDGEQTYTMNKENEIVASDGLLINEYFRRCNIQDNRKYGTKKIYFC